MSVYTLLLYLAYFILIILSIILITASLPIKIISETNVDGLYFNELVEFSILFGFLGGNVNLDSTKGSFQLKVATFPVFTTKWVNEEDETEENIDKEKKKKEPGSKKRRNFRILLDPGKKLLTSILRRIYLRFDLDLVAGLSDPYICGLLFGFIYPVVHFVELYCKNCSVTVTPVFIQETFKGRLFLFIRFTPILFVFPLLGFFVSREFREYRRSGGN